jgi:hypothetical protein
MKNLFAKTLAVLLISFSFSCDKDGGPEILPVGETLTGSWILTEEGYSPGSGYITKHVESRPEQTLTFKANGEMSSNISGFAAYQHYLILENPQAPGQHILALFTTKPVEEPQDVNKLSPAYDITFTDDLLKLSFRWCIEGCHVGLKRFGPEGL